MIDKYFKMEEIQFIADEVECLL